MLRSRDGSTTGAFMRLRAAAVLKPLLGHRLHQCDQLSGLLVTDHSVDPRIEQLLLFLVVYEQDLDQFLAEILDRPQLREALVNPFEISFEDPVLLAHDRRRALTFHARPLVEDWKQDFFFPHNVPLQSLPELRKRMHRLAQIIGGERPNCPEDFIQAPMVTLHKLLDHAHRSLLSLSENLSQG